MQIIRSKQCRPLEANNADHQKQTMQIIRSKQCRSLEANYADHQRQTMQIIRSKLCRSPEANNADNPRQIMPRTAESSVCKYHLNITITQPSVSVFNFFLQFKRVAGEILDFRHLMFFRIGYKGYQSFVHIT